MRNFVRLRSLFSVALFFLNFSGSVELCKIATGGRISESTFVFSEVPEDYPVGEKLPKSLSILTGELESAVLKLHQETCVRQYSGQDYILAKCNNETNQIDFYLQQSLRNYHLRRWKPSIEFEFDLICSKDDFPYTYMITIEDANLHQPKFSSLGVESKKYSGTLNYTTLHGFKIYLKSENATENGIHLNDPDFNLKHANISISCEGESCSFLTFHPKHKGFSEGHNFYIDVSLNEPELEKFNLKNGSTLQFSITANDSKYVSESVNVNLLVSLKNALVNPDSSSSSVPVPLAAAAGGLSLLLLFCSGTMAYFVVSKRNAKKILRKLTETEIREFLEGAPSIESSKRSIDVNTPIMALPYNRAFEIPRDKLRIDETTILGTGAFGIVWKGSVVYSNGDGITVAVKTVKRNVGVLYFKALLSELKIMAYIQKHPNIVSLVGACTHNIRKREVYIAVQYCSNGNFHNYLKCRRDRFSNLVVDGKLQLTNSATYSFMYSTKGCFSKSITTLDLIQWSTQIANGLQYLESLGIIHGDLATRNILLDHERVAKIGDFGLSRRLIDYSNYYYKLKASETPLPWKWMSPECLQDMKFSKKSDIWSFGIVLWEVFTLGQTPYPGLNWDESFIGRLEKGLRPSKPPFATIFLYDMMCDCWNLDPHDRPSIFDLKRALENMTDAALRQKKDLSYMRFLEETPHISMLSEDSEGYLQPNDPNRKMSEDL